VGTGGGVVRLSAVQPHGKKEMAAADWARGVRIDAGERFSHE
jgi:methionyl-tRNA formyltransferase